MSLPCPFGLRFPPPPPVCLTRPLVSFGSVYHEELNAPIRRNKEEPKARPLRVGDTEKPEPDREYGGGREAACSGCVAQGPMAGGVGLGGAGIRASGPG